MAVIGTAENGQRHRRQVAMPDGTLFGKGEWMDSGTDLVFAPTVFLVEQPPNYSVATHFHRQNEFQIVVQGSGRLGRHAIGPYTIHYAGAYTGYGPLVSGPEGLFYFTLRFAFDKGPLYPSTDRALLRRGPKRQLSAGPVQPLGEGGLASTHSLVKTELIAPQPDGISAHRWTLPADHPIEFTADSSSGGCFLFLLDGSLELNAHSSGSANRLVRWESVYFSPGERSEHWRASAAGADLLALQLAPTDPAYVDPR
jgi:hypothetical protein